MVAMTRRKAILVAVLLVAGGLVVYVTVPREQRVTEANCKRIVAGMARSEVVEILGVNGDYRTRPTADQGLSYWVLLPGSSVQWDLWRGDGLDLLVGFDEQGQVVDTQNVPTDPQDVGVVELLRWRAERAWQRWSNR
jgi:hypothetical protein